MYRRFLLKLGLYRSLALITIISCLSSILLYIIIAFLFGRISIIGIISALTIPLVATSLGGYFVLNLVFQLNQTEEELKKAKEELEEKVKKRTKGLLIANKRLRQEIKDRKEWEKKRSQLESRLQQAKKMETIGTLAGGVAHDLNNILGGIVSYPDLLLMQIPENSPLRESIKIIKESGEKAAGIVQDLLTLARRSIIDKKPINLNQIVNEYLSSPEFKKIKQKHPLIQIKTNLTPDLKVINGSPIHLSKALMNLIINAIEAIPGEGEIVITTENRHIDIPAKANEYIKEGDYTLLIVSDNGIGISKKDKEKIFEPFYTKKSMGKSGTGLGMTIVWGTITDHHGFIDVQSSKRKGTVFNLFFPVAKEKVPDVQLPLSIEDYHGNGESILIVDDEKEQQEIAIKILEKLNYSVFAVSSGLDACQYLKKNPTDLIVLDMVMDPGIDGFETYKRIIKINPRQKAIIVSGYAETERVKQAIKLGVGAYVKKPYVIKTLGMAIKKELSKNARIKE